MEVKFWLLLLLIKDCGGRKGKNNNCITDDGKSDSSSFLISCGSDHVIFNPVITSGRGPCKHPECEGQSPDLMVDIRQCNWKHTCVLEFPRRPMISDNSCIAKHVDYLKLHHWACVPDTMNKGDSLILDICQNHKNGYIANSGVIRSHFNFPWLYMKDIFDNGDCKVTLHGKQNMKLVISVNNMSISEETDKAWILNQKTNEKINLTECLPPSGACIFDFSNAHSISIIFNGNRFLSKGDSGFVLCYKMIESSERLKGDNVCDEIMQKPNMNRCSKKIISEKIENNALRRCRFKKKKDRKKSKKSKGQEGKKRRKHSNS